MIKELEMPFKKLEKKQLNLIDVVFIKMMKEKTFFLFSLLGFD